MSRLYRSRRDRYITGLCGGLSEVMGIDSTWIRLLLVIAAFFSGGVVIPLYFLAVLVIPKEPFAGGPFGPQPHFGGPGQGAWNDDPSQWGSQYGQQWGKQWGRQWGGKRRHCGRHDQYNEYEAQYSQPGSAYKGQPGQGQTDADFEDKMKDIEKKAMWKEIEELRAKLESYEKNQQSKGDV